MNRSETSPKINNIEGEPTSELSTDTKKYIIKIVVLGDANVGKSNIIRRILNYDFQELEATIGVEFAFVDVKDADPLNKDVTLSIQIWDTSGAERYRAITTSHMRNADGVYLVYDITSEKSFKMLQYWYDSVKMSTSDDIVIYLLGNKSDLKTQKNYKKEKFVTVPTQKAISFVKDYNLQGYVECSAKENINITDSFKTFYKKIYEKQKSQLEEKTKTRMKLLVGKKQDPKYNCC